MAHDSIAVIDFGGQYAHLIATKVRRRRVLAEMRRRELGVEDHLLGQGTISADTKV